MSKFFCLHIETGKTGTLHITDDSIVLKLRSFGSSFALNHDDGQRLVLEGGKSCTLLDTFDTGLPLFFEHIAPVTCRVEVYANLAIVGNTFWQSDRQISEISFVVPGSDRILVDTSVVARLSISSFPEHDNSIFRASYRGTEVSAKYRMRAHSCSTAIRFAPTLSVSFESPVSIQGALLHIFDITTFMSFSCGNVVRGEDFKIVDRKQDQVPEVFDLSLTRDELTDPTIEDTPVFWCGSREETDCFQSALSAWLSRVDDWRIAHSLMMGCIRDRSTLDAARVINLCRWFESVPNNRPLRLLNDQLITSTLSAVESLNIPGFDSEMRNRVRGGLSFINAESRASHFSRVVEGLRAEFGTECLPDDTADDLGQAFAFRGIAAHSESAGLDKSKVDELYHAVLALEAVCVLLTARGLPMGPNQLRRLLRRRSLRRYATAVRQRAARTGRQ